MLTQYRLVDSNEVMEEIVAEMKAYAKMHPFYHEKLMQEALADPELKKEMHGPMMRVKGTTDVMKDYNRHVALNSKNGTVFLQMAYTIAADQDIAGLEQLTIVDGQKNPLEESMINFVIGYFFPNGTKLMLAKTPSHVCVVLRPQEPVI